MFSDLNSKGAIVTGGTRGIGFAISSKLIRDGAKVVICSRTKLQLKTALKKIASQNVYGMVCDVSKLSDCKRLIKFAKKKLKQVDILVNNAGIYGEIGLLEKVNLQQWEKTLKINFISMVQLCHLVIPLMKKRGGKIINLCGAGVGASTMPRFSAYFSSKFAIAGFSELLADELAPYNIFVNAISPGAVNTYLNDYLLKTGVKKTGRKMYETTLSIRKSGGTPPNLAANLVAYLASPQSNHITGRLLSAKWNPPEKLAKVKLTDNLYKLRRIDQELFYEK